ncbi:MAG: hypothetical protein KC646_14525 [Candidatus Cloacimonetes bacterium]|nr:hypothetical protein [Candidatus Cloacimonadota bacterium]
MSIRPIDIQTTLTGSTQASDIRQKQQGVEHLHQTNPQGEVDQMDDKLLHEVSELKEDQEVDSDGSNKQEQEAKKKEAEAKAEAEAKKTPISDGVRGLNLDFSV